jgi:hypothetical protein
VGNSGDSPNAHAPVFRRLDERVAASELRRRLGELSSGGHREMPPIFMSPDEIRDLVAYVGTLERETPAAMPGKGRRI